MKNKFKAFTLIELLVVIVIIGILATISVASFNGYLQRANDARKQSEIDQIGKIIMNYTTLEETASHMKGTCDLTGQSITYATGHYHPNEGDSVPDGSHSACLVKYLKSRGVHLPDPKKDCYVAFYEVENPEKFAIISASDFIKGKIYFSGTSDVKFYVKKDGINYQNLRSYVEEFINHDCREYGLNGLNIYRSGISIETNNNFFHTKVEPLDPRYFSE